MSNEPVTTVLRIDASMRAQGSVTRQLADRLIERLTSVGAARDISHRDLATDPAPFVDEAWIGANFTDPGERTDEQKARLAASDAMVSELKAADVLVIATPIYNFGIPAALKAWIDQIARARETFRYTENGPVGLLEGKKAYILVASGGTAIGSEIDFATPYLKHALKFVGIEDVTIVAAERLMMRGEEALDEAIAAIDTDTVARAA